LDRPGRKLKTTPQQREEEMQRTQTEEEWFEDNYNKTGPFEYAVIFLTVLLVFYFVGQAHKPSIPDDPDVETLADAIYWSEGGEKAYRPYGILSVPCDTHESCRQICINTIVNQNRRWKDDGANGRFIDSLWARYTGNPTKGDNKFWKKNVTYFYFNPKEVPIDRTQQGS
jgi:hypothetical protein